MCKPGWVTSGTGGGRSEISLEHATAEQKLRFATEFKIGELLIQSRGEGRRAISSGSHVFGRDGKFVYEPRPSARSKEFIESTRFTLDEAFNRLEEAQKAYEDS